MLHINIEKLLNHHRRKSLIISSVLIYIIATIVIVSTQTTGITGGYLLIAAALVGGYLAMNIGANDVANNIGPLVGSRAMTLAGAIALAAVFEVAGALVAGGSVTATIKDGIIDSSSLSNSSSFVWLMFSALLAGAIWLNLATAFGAPVSTTHSVLGGVVGAGIAAGNVQVVNWPEVMQIAASWIISPLIGGLVAASVLYFLKYTITYRPDMKAATIRVMPWMVAIMISAFSAFLIIKGLRNVLQLDFSVVVFICAAIAFVSYHIVKTFISRRADNLLNEKNSVNKLFTIPLIFSAALLSFSHGANDVANVIGPLSAIHGAIVLDSVVETSVVPWWIMLIGALGIALGLSLFGYRLISIVGQEITELDQVRAFSIAMAVAITVIIASQFGFPVSSTHITVGAVFGVGFLREYLKSSYEKMIMDIRFHHKGKNENEIENFLSHFQRVSINEKNRILKEIKRQSESVNLTKKERKKLKKAIKSELVKRSTMYLIILAWLATLPVTAIMAALIYSTIMPSAVLQ